MLIMVLSKTTSCDKSEYNHNYTTITNMPLNICVSIDLYSMVILIDVNIFKLLLTPKYFQFHQYFDVYAFAFKHRLMVFNVIL